MTLTMQSTLMNERLLTLGGSQRRRSRPKTKVS
jgi:hypothetical protein